MKKLFLKLLVYTVLVLISLEFIIRIFHLTKDYPTRYVDKFDVEKWVPNQEGFTVTGIRRQNFSKYHINQFGFNSYREYLPSKSKTELALVGDSFIEGFHQPYYDSTGKKIETLLENVEVYEFGYAGYDFADQLHLINKYNETFSLIDYVVLGLKFENDLTRGEYTVLQERMKLESSLYKTLRQVKLLVYLQNIGAFDAVKGVKKRLLTFNKKLTKANSQIQDHEVTIKKHIAYIKNFETLINSYGFDKTRYFILLDK